MQDRLRFTGENPPPSLWLRYPNWQIAYEEEGFPGQDESTLRPADNQELIDQDVNWTAGDVVYSDGRKFAAFLAIIDGETCCVVNVYPQYDRNMFWSLACNASEWVACNGDWSLEADWYLAVPLDEPGIFPLRVTSRLRLKISGMPISLEIELPTGP